MEKRYSKRILSRVKARFGKQAPEALGFALNMSADGLYISSTRIFPPRTRLVLQLEPLNAPMIELVGLVRWSQQVPASLISVVKPGMGVKIDAPGRQYLDFFSGLVKKHPQRSSQRVDARLEVHFYRRDQLIKEYTENICRGGVFIATEEVFEPGEDITVDLIIPDLAAVWQVTGRVAYRLDQDQARRLESPAGIGVQITKTDPVAEEAFHAYVRRIMLLYT